MKDKSNTIMSHDITFFSNTSMSNTVFDLTRIIFADLDPIVSNFNNKLACH